jgi:hypothetical protein
MTTDIDNPTALRESGKWSRAAPGTPEQLKHLLESEGLFPDLIDQWVASPERSWYMERRRIIARWCALGVGFLLLAVWAAAATLDESGLTPLRLWGIVAAVAAVITLGWCTVPYWAARRAFSSRIRAAARYRVEHALKELRYAMEDPDSGTNVQFARMFELNRGQLDEYQQLTKSQQKTAFALTWGAAVAALFILIAGSILALRIGDEDKYITGGLTALGSLLSAFLGKTFFDGHREAMEQLNHYYNEPSLTGRLLAAERILNQLPEGERTEKVGEMLTKILAWEAPPRKTKKDDKPASDNEEEKPPN